jgi:hypothetical protein
VVAFVDNDVPIAAEEIGGAVGPPQRLDHRDVDLFSDPLPTATDAADGLRRDVSEVTKPRRPLFHEWVSVYKDQRGTPVSGNWAGCGHSLPPFRRGAEHAGLIREHRVHCLSLCVVEIAVELDHERLSTNARILQLNADVEFG